MTFTIDSESLFQFPQGEARTNHFLWEDEAVGPKPSIFFLLPYNRLSVSGGRETTFWKKKQGCSGSGGPEDVHEPNLYVAISEKWELLAATSDKFCSS